MMIKKPILILLGFLSLILGIIGAFLPIMPTTPFAILAAYFFSKSSPRLHKLILDFKYIGPLVRDWEENRVIRAKAKVLCTILILTMMTGSLVFGDVHWVVKTILILIGTSVLTFVLTRPSTPK